MSLHDHCTNLDECGPALIPLLVFICDVSYACSAERCANAQDLLCRLVGNAGRMVLIVVKTMSAWIRLVRCGPIYGIGAANQTHV